MRALGFLVVLTACEGTITVPAGAFPDAPPPSMQPPVKTDPNDGWPTFAPAEAFQLRRLTSEQYAASVKSLLGVSTVGLPPIEPVSPVAGFASIGASAAVVSSGGVGQFETAAIFLAHAAFATNPARQTLTPCTPSSATDLVCFKAFAASFGKRAFRRPLASDEIDRYAALASTVATSTNDVWQGLELAASAFLQSPNFLYLSEIGEPDPAQPGRLRYTDYEMASRLSYFLTNDTPDDALLAAAAAGQLTTPQGVKAQADRLIASSAAHSSVRGFFSAMLALDGLDTLSRPVQAFPQYTSTLGPALKEEALLALDDLVFAKDASYRDAFDQPVTFLSSELATFYGLPDPGGSGFSRVVVPPTSPRLGLFGQAGVLAVHDTAGGTSPTKRGLFVLTRLLCQDLALAPPSGLIIPPAPQGILTARQRLSQHVGNAACASCHVQMDAVGLSLEKFDALGEYRELDRGLTIDDSGELQGTKYKGEAGLGALVAKHPALEPCLAQALYGAGLGHRPTEFDRQGFGAVVTDFHANGARVRTLMSAITASDGFRYAPATN